MDDPEIRLECLKLVSRPDKAPQVILEEARALYEFVTNSDVNKRQIMQQAWNGLSGAIMAGAPSVPKAGKVMKRHRCPDCRKMVRDKPVLGTLHFCSSPDQRRLLAGAQQAALAQRRFMQEVRDNPEGRILVLDGSGEPRASFRAF